MTNNRQFQKQLEQEIRELSEMQKKLQNQLINVPEGSLHIHKIRKGKYSQYYAYLDGEERYLPVENQKMIQALAQKAYDEKVLAIIDARLKGARRLLKDYQQKIMDVYLKLPASRKKLVTPIIPTDEDFIKAWHEKHPGSVNPYPNNSVIYSERGESVRSKSEKILADLFYRHDIPYIYEPQIVLAKGKTVYPDFLLLNMKQRKTYVYEHFGMMDNSEYAKNMSEKIEMYLENGYWYGENLLFSMETSTNLLNTRTVEKMLCHFFEQ